MADVNKPKLQLRSGLTTNGDKTPSPATKLLINHGKPNFTIQRSMKAQNGNVKPTSPNPAPTFNIQQNNNAFVVKSTTFNGVFKPSNISDATKQTLPQNGNTITYSGADNEAAKVVLRRAKCVQTEMGEGEDDANVPEFIRRQRRIQERLANQNILDFENRRSGYFTQVLISPTNPNRQSFVETMASPAVKPGLEIPPPPPVQHEGIKEETKEQEHEQQQHQHQQSEFEESRENVLAEHVTTRNGHVEEEEVAKAIEEVNKAVEGEDDDKTELEEKHETEQNITTAVLDVVTLQHVEETKPDENEKQKEGISKEETPFVAAVVSSVAEVTLKQTQQENYHGDATTVASAPFIEDTIQEFKSNGHVEEHLENGQLKEKLDNEITISHVNGLNGPSIPSPDPKGEKGVNFEPKTVVSFSQELGNGDNKYPDTVKVVKDVDTLEADSELKELTKLKFEIKADNQDIEVRPVLIAENA